jgi:GLPGLI family protein
MKKSILIIIMLFTGHTLLAQYTRFVTAGTIEFDKTINMYAYMENQVNKINETYMRPAVDQYKRSQPQFKIMKSKLTFANDKSLFEPIAATENSPYGIVNNDPVMVQNNVIYSDLTSGTSTTQKTVFEQIFLVKDSTRKITWKITDETREIAGYTCRRANALIMDSIYVVAFYSEKIVPSGGPESFSGLPGMILGVALPYEHVTWFATKVTDAPPSPLPKAPVKGKPVNNEELRTTLTTAFKKRYNFAQVLKACLL